jgi:opacity protein-like surface antigen
MRKVILAAVTIAFSTSIQAQDASPKTTFGVKANLNLSSANIKRSYDTDVSSLVGFNVGGFANFKLDEKWSFQPELLYSKQGFKEYLDDSGYIYDEKVKLDYINVPLNFQHKITSNFYLEAGVQLDFLLSAKGEGEYYDPMFDLSTSFQDLDIKDNFKSISYGINIGTGYFITKQLSVNARYHFGLANIADFEGTKARNRNFQVGLGYTFN